MVNKHTKRCTKPLVTREMQIKITIRYYFTPTKMAIINKGENNKCWMKIWRNWNPPTWPVGI